MPSPSPALVRAQKSLARGDARTALQCANEAQRLAPRDAGVALTRGRALLAMGRGDEGIEALERAALLDPNCADVQLGLGQAQHRRGMEKEAFRHFIKALELNPSAPHVLTGAGNFMLESGQLAEAQGLFSVACSMGSLEAVAGLLGVYEHRNELNEGLQLLENHKQQISTSRPLALAGARLLRRAGRAEEALAVLDNMSDAPGHGSSDAPLHYERGTILESLARYDQAFTAFTAGNAAQGVRFDGEGFEERLEGLRERYATSAAQGLPRAQGSSDLPILIVGMPRSGTSLAEQILATHADVHGAGELDLLRTLIEDLDLDDEAALTVAGQSYIAALRELGPGAKRVTDKMPQNFQLLGAVAQVLPGCRVVHCVRDPLDTCVSCFTKNFVETHDYATDLADLGRYYQGYAGLMEHWRAIDAVPIFELRYEELVAQPERVMRDLLEFCGLDWDAAVLRFHETDRQTATASYAQVRKPLNAGSVGRARNYADHLAPLIAALGPRAEENSPNATA